ncbi:MAG: type II toxin-antitoxin system HicA family toxin [Candidatus Hydrogenedentes bacterium]|nr:type II toxin-antitoxin system HicA family toxin [Candidatus Hydrogenedentota bacterium]
MPKQMRLTAADAERLLLKAGFIMSYGRGSHRVYRKGSRKVEVPFHGSRVLHPKIVKQVLTAIQD